VPPNSSVRVPIEADEAGEEGNIEGQRLDFAALPTGARQVVFAETKERLTGGSGEEVAVVSEAEEKYARDEALQGVEELMEREMVGELPPGWELMRESWTVVLSTFSLGAKIGDKLPEVSYEGRAQAKVIGYEKVKLEELLKKRLEEELDKGYKLFPGELSYTVAVEGVDWDEAKASVKARVSHTTMPDISLETLRGKLAGRSLQDAKVYLEGIKGIKNVSIATWPFWVNTLPRVEGRMTVDLRSERQP
jgi:hypothetical protein